MDVIGHVSGRELLALAFWFAAALALTGYVAACFERGRKASAPASPPPVNRKREVQR